MSLAYRLAKLRFLPQQLIATVVFGIVLLLASHFLTRPDERTWLRDAGASVITFAAARWLSQQGRRRIDSQGHPLRTQTMRFKLPEGRS